jgi:signal transduction histidine kinase/ActR/RegA family two-component response regulator
VALEDEEERSQLRSVALQNVQSILEARLKAEQELLKTKEALEEETRVLELLNATGAKLASNLDLDAVVQAVTDAATELSGAQFGAFFYTATTPEGSEWTLCTLSGAAREDFAKFPPPRATPLFGPTFRGDAPVRIADVLADPRYGQWAPHHGMPPGHLPVRSYLAVPVLSRQGEILGGLFFGHATVGVFTERAERLVVGIASQAAIAIDNARLYEGAKRAAAARAEMLEAERAARAESDRIGVLKDEFLATLSHELRTPLNAVLGWGRILLDRLTDASPDVRRGLEAIVRNAQAQVSLIDDLLDMNRIVSGKIRLDVQAVEIAPIVNAALDVVRPTAATKDIRLRTAIDPAPIPALADPNRIQQIVWNLLSNAVKFTPKGGTIDVVVQRVNSHIEIIVQDAGIGISPDFLPHVFDRFRQADASTTRKQGGLGLGLAIAKQLVELHGGTIRAESAGEGKGATFIVGIPLRAVQDPASERREHPRAAGDTPLPSLGVSLTGLRILVVDDQADARDLMHSVLVGAGAKVLTAESADEALALLTSQRPDVIVSDIGMPGRDGYELMRAIRALPPESGGRTPAIALTAFARPEDRMRAMLAGFQVHLNKPIEPQELLATVRSTTLASGQ